MIIFQCTVQATERQSNIKHIPGLCATFCFIINKNNKWFDSTPNFHIYYMHKYYRTSKWKRAYSRIEWHCSATKKHHWKLDNSSTEHLRNTKHFCNDLSSAVVVVKQYLVKGVFNWISSRQILWPWVKNAALHDFNLFYPCTTLWLDLSDYICQHCLWWLP